MLEILPLIYCDFSIFIIYPCLGWCRGLTPEFFAIVAQLLGYLSIQYFIFLMVMPNSKGWEDGSVCKSICCTDMTAEFVSPETGKAGVDEDFWGCVGSQSSPRFWVRSCLKD